MALTKKDFEAIAKELNAVMPSTWSIDAPAFYSAVEAVARGLRTTNPNFNTGRFIDTATKERLTQ